MFVFWMKMKIPILKNKISIFTQLNKFFLLKLIKPKVSHLLSKKSHRLLAIKHNSLSIISSSKLPELRTKINFFSNYLEPFTLFSLHKEVPTFNEIPIGFFLQHEFFSLLNKKIFKKIRRTKRRLFHRRIKTFKKLLLSYYYWKRKMKKGKRTYKLRLETHIKNLRKKKLLKKKITINETGIPIFNKLVQLITRHGLKRKAYTNLKLALNLLRKNLKISRSSIFLNSQFLYLAVKKINPSFYIRKINLGRRTIFAPAPLHQHKKTTLSLRWILNSLEKRKESTFSKRLAGELEDVLKNKGLTIKFKKDQEKLAYDNRFNSRYLFKPN